MKLAINVAAMLIAFLALIAMGDAMIGWCGAWFGLSSGRSPNCSATCSLRSPG